jgi:hypothetical protein
MARGKAIEQIEFNPDGREISPDAPVAYYDENYVNHPVRKQWLLVVGLMNVTFTTEEKPEVIRRLKNVVEMLEED